MGRAKLCGLLIDRREDVTRRPSRDPDPPAEVAVEVWLRESCLQRVMSALLRALRGVSKRRAVRPAAYSTGPIPSPSRSLPWIIASCSVLASPVSIRIRPRRSVEHWNAPTSPASPFATELSIVLGRRGGSNSGPDRGRMGRMRHILNSAAVRVPMVKPPQPPPSRLTGDPGVIQLDVGHLIKHGRLVRHPCHVGRIRCVKYQSRHHRNRAC